MYADCFWAKVLLIILKNTPANFP
ncbi:hypothetical protein AGR1C_Cc40152 [Agrobacterium fabacearum TT111]|nr:hypothetical protein AGR1C_Cc40152 [Agrobacterium fabacearum TT111]